jgi:DNA processing protein
MNIEFMFLVHRFDFLGVAEKCLLVDLFDRSEGLLALRQADLECLLRRHLRPLCWDPQAARRQAEADARWLDRRACSVLVFGQAGYPAWLAAIDEPPFVLFCHGQPPSDRQDLLAVVGTRHPSEPARMAAWELGRECAEADIGLVSGLAQGIDGAAHAGCVLQGGYTVGILAGGIDQVQPRSHRLLVARMIDAGGAVMSEYGPGTLTRKWHFPIRNRIISGLCPAVVVVEAPVKSGALITAQYGLEQGRDVYVHTAGCESFLGTGTSNLAESGAPIIQSLRDLDGYGANPHP